MRPLTALALAALALVPASASAQSAAGSLGTPYDSVEIELAPAPGAAHVPEAYAQPASEPSAPPAPTATGSTWRVVGSPTVLDRRTRREMIRAERRYEAERRAQAERERGGPGFAASFGHSWVGFAIGAGGGGLIGGAIAGAACNDGGSDVGGMCPLVALGSAAIGAMALAPLGSAISVWAFADSRGGTGNAFAALGGAYLGAGLGIGVAAAFAAGNLGVIGAFAGPILGVLLTNLGAAAGYHLSSHGPRAERAVASRTEPLVVPMLAPTEDGQGAMAGVGGTF